jgi:hypothetical protein
MRVRAFYAVIATCLLAAVLLATAKPPLDSYLIEYTDECLLKRTCPILEWDSRSGIVPFPVVPRQVKIRDGGARIDIIAPQGLPIIDLDSYLSARQIGSGKR